MLSKGAVDESVADAKMQARPQSQVKAEDWTFKVEDHGPSRPRPWTFKAKDLTFKANTMDLQGQDHGSSRPRPWTFKAKDWTFKVKTMDLAHLQMLGPRSLNFLGKS